jgi:predicted Zn-dependent protease
MLLGKNQNQWVQIASELANGLVDLQFSRKDEYEADKYAVISTYPTNWDAGGIADFFDKMDHHSPTPVFLSTHPSDEQRVKKVNEEWTKLGGKKGEDGTESYKDFKSALP